MRKCECFPFAHFIEFVEMSFFKFVSLLSFNRFFERDVSGVREYFRKRYGYECAGYPLFEDLTRDDNIDVEVSCSGYTKEMEKDLLQVNGRQMRNNEKY